VQTDIPTQQAATVTVGPMRHAPPLRQHGVCDAATLVNWLVSVGNSIALPTQPYP